jgi:anti-sigma-K factor RskA
MTCAEVEDLIELYVIGALPADEAREVAAHLDSCPGCRELERNTIEVVQVMRLGADQLDPSPGLRSRLMSAVKEGELVAVGAAATPVASGRWRALRGWLRPALPVPLAAAVAAIPLLLSAWLGWQVMQLRSEVQSTETALVHSWETSQNAAEILGKAVERGGAMARLQGMEMAPAASGMLYYMPSASEGVLVVNGLPEIARGRVFQCWLVSGERRVSGGTFYRESDGRALLVIKSPLPLESVDAVGVTEEPHGGSPEPGAARYVWGRLRRV